MPRSKPTRRACCGSGARTPIAALAYGTASIPRVDKIVGPGNAWVAAAKALVAADCGVDLQAGPSEIVVFSESGRPDWIAADLVAQAEHDPDARAVFVTTRTQLADRVHEALATIDRREGTGTPIARPTRRDRRDETRAGPRLDVINRLAPEHLVCDRAADVAGVRAAGTVFVGRWSAQAAGDYCTGSNHVLPTGGSARFRGGLSAADFVRAVHRADDGRRGLRSLGPHVMALADRGRAAAHGESIRVRMRDL